MAADNIYPNNFAQPHRPQREPAQRAAYLLGMGPMPPPRPQEVARHVVPSWDSAPKVHRGSETVLVQNNKIEGQSGHRPLNARESVSLAFSPPISNWRPSKYSSSPWTFPAPRYYRTGQLLDDDEDGGRLTIEFAEAVSITSVDQDLNDRMAGDRSEVVASTSAVPPVDPSDEQGMEGIHGPPCFDEDSSTIEEEDDDRGRWWTGSDLDDGDNDDDELGDDGDNDDNQENVVTFSPRKRSPTFAGQD
ncbi:hypothetical protein K443DRAFT_9358 [Laccaria amethystina LaAM-08-1]|uniref:Uncharacterized protein n=1 Tax=Laccaria amethystina LaAM-08-1 TaxID=1095629 RepID=A0A0C9XKP4_9AGAR|nr:hypothetical protein K443DRAFT_9358 [Laccaria amethystina LaAM-08-1]